MDLSNVDQLFGDVIVGGAGCRHLRPLFHATAHAHARARALVCAGMQAAVRRRIIAPARA